MCVLHVCVCFVSVCVLFQCGFVVVVVFSLVVALWWEFGVVVCVCVFMCVVCVCVFFKCVF